MNLKTLIGAAAMTLVMAAPFEAKAATIIDTGTPVASTANWSFYENQYFAGQFVLAAESTITLIEGFLELFGAGDIAVSILGTSGSTADAGNVFFRQTVSVDTGPARWLGARDLNVVLGPGTYWAAIEAVTASGIWGRTAGSPIDEYAQNSSGVWRDVGENFYDYLDVSIRVEGTPVSPVPLPAGGLLLLTGLGGLAAVWRKKRSAG